MELINAKMARKLLEDKRKYLYQEKIEYINNQINAAIEKGESKVILCDLNSEILKILTANGYKIEKSFNDNLNLSETYIIYF